MDVVLSLNTILGRWGLRASSAWNFSGNPCTGVAIDQTQIQNLNPGVKCVCTYNNSNTCHITQLYGTIIFLETCLEFF